YSGGGFSTLAPVNGAPGDETANVEDEYLDPSAKKLQQLQKYIDSKQIGEVGETELEKAKEYYEDANIVLGLAEHITDDEMREKVIRFANAAKRRAESDMEVANNILKAGKKLRTGASQNEEIAKTSSMSKGSVYYVQVGAFRQPPRPSDFSSLGKVRIVKEDGF